MAEVRVAACNRCCWWDQVEGQEPGFGVCRGSVPQAIPKNDLEASEYAPVLWPETHADDYCRGFEVMPGCGHPRESIVAETK